jgi:transcriptional regulator with XRE-family HTH domain
MPHAVARTPSSVFGRRLQERRRAVGWSQAELAAAMTREGFEMGKTAVLRIENGTRELKLDEAIAFAEILNFPFAYLLEPPPDEMVSLTEQRATDGDGITRWLVTGTPLGGLVWPGQMRTRHDRELAAVYLRDLASMIVNAVIVGDADRRKHAEQQFAAAIKRAQEQARDGADASDDHPPSWRPAVTILVDEDPQRAVPPVRCPHCNLELDYPERHICTYRSRGPE